MNLSNELITQFVKATKDTIKTSSEKTVSGTTVEYNGKMYVKLDGSDLLTPVSTTTDVIDNERVTVLIKDHTATITGNTSSPAARTDDVKDVKTQITEVEILVADKVSTEELEAQKGRIDTLVSDNATIREKLTAAEAEIDSLVAEDAVINDKLTAQDAEITRLDAEKLTANAADIKFATIENLETLYGEFHSLESTYGEFQELTTVKMEAVDANVKNLEAEIADIDALYAKKADVDDLYAKKADVELLEADVAELDTLIFGSASGTSIQTSFANAVIAQLGNAQIKSAMIDSISASKIDSGSINTNNVNIASEDGRLVLSDETIQISDSNRVRVQIGKDAKNDYSISIWDADGNLMFSEGGITDSAIKEAIIRNDMVASDANISAKKLDISSLFTEINDSTETISAGKIYMDADNQTLDVSFTKMSSDLDAIDDAVSSQGTQLSIVQEQISSKIWEQDIKTATDELGTELDTLSTKQSSLEQTVDGISAAVSSHESEIAKKADDSTVTTISNKVTEIETSLDGFKSTVTNTYVTETQLATTNDKVDQAAAAALTAQSTADTANANATAAQKAANDADAKAEQAKNDLATAQQNLADVVSRVDATEEEIEAAEAAVEVAKNNAAAAQQAADEAQDAVDALDVRVTTAETSINQTAEQIALMATKQEVDETLEGYYTKEEAAAVITVKANEITQTVSETYTTKDEFDGLEIGGRNLLLNSSLVEDMDEWTAIDAEITSIDGVACCHIAGALESENYVRQSVVDKIDWNNLEQVYTFSADMRLENFVKGETSPYLGLHFSGQYDDNGTTAYLGAATVSGSPYIAPYAGTGWVRLVWVVRFTQVLDMLRAHVYTRDFTGDLYFKNLKLEKGNKATDWTPAPEDVEEKIDSGDSAIRDNMTQQITSIVQDTENIILTALDSYATTDSVGELKESIQAELAVMAEKITMNFNGSLEEIASVEGELQSWVAQYSKYISFSEQGITINSGNGSVTLQLDNEEGIIISRNGVVRSRLTDDDFYTGNIVVEVNERAQFGNLAAVPRSKGSLMWVKVGG